MHTVSIKKWNGQKAALGVLRAGFKDGGLGEDQPPGEMAPDLFSLCARALMNFTPVSKYLFVFLFVCLRVYD